MTGTQADLPKREPNADRAKQVVLEIIAAKGGRFAGKTLLYKVFYLSHLYYWLESKGALTDYPIVRMPHGPGIDRGDDLLLEMERAGLIEISSQDNGPYREAVYLLKKPFEVDPTDPRHNAILRALEWLGGRSAADVSEFIHVHSRSWQNAANGQELAIYLDLLTEEEFARLKQTTDEADEIVRAAFG